MLGREKEEVQQRETVSEERFPLVTEYMGNVMIHKILMGAAALAVVASSAYAVDFTHNVGLQATVGSACTITNPPVVTQGGDYLTVTSAGASTFSAPIDQATQTAQVVTGELTFNNSICNTPSTLSVTRSPFESSVVAPDGFVNKIPYGMRVTWGEEIIGEGTPGDIDGFTEALGPKSGNLSLTIEIVEDNVPLAKGTYAGTVAMTLSPN